MITSMPSANGARIPVLRNLARVTVVRNIHTSICLERHSSDHEMTTFKARLISYNKLSS